jgi:hypothetical protein
LFTESMDDIGVLCAKGARYTCPEETNPTKTRCFATADVRKTECVRCELLWRLKAIISTAYRPCQMNKG